jgi:hypothetical protein
MTQNAEEQNLRKKYNETGILLYERLAESETKTISEIRDAIIEASLYMN